MKYYIYLLCFLCATVIQTFAQTHNPNFVDLPNGRVNTVEVDNNYVYIGGAFTQCGATPRNNIARYDRFTGALDMIWNPNSSHDVFDIEAVNGNVYIGGFFTTVGGQARNYIAKLSATGTGTADATWNPNANSLVTDIEVSETDVFVAGDFTTIGGQARNKVAKLSPIGTGAADPVWNPNASTFVFTIELHGSDVYAGGMFTTIGGQARNYIAKLSATGTGAADATWDPNSDNFVNCIDVLGSDVYVGGSFTTIGGQARNYIAKLSATGTGAADATWNPNTTGTFVTSISATDEGIFVGGQFTDIGGQTRSNAAKLFANGTGIADPGWSVPFNGSITGNSAITYRNGIVFIGGEFTSPTDHFFVSGTYFIPTLGEWGMIFFAMSIIGVGVYFSKKQRYSEAV